METDVSESESGRESELEGVVVVSGREVGNFRGFFRSRVMSFFGSAGPIISQNNL